jgi:hypothetical protein
MPDGLHLRPRNDRTPLIRELYFRASGRVIVSALLRC